LRIGDGDGDWGLGNILGYLRIIIEYKTKYYIKYKIFF